HADPDCHRLRHFSGSVSRVLARHEPREPGLHRGVHHARLFRWSGRSGTVRSIAPAGWTGWFRWAAAAPARWTDPGSPRTAASAAEAGVAELGAGTSGARSRPAGHAGRAVY